MDHGRLQSADLDGAQNRQPGAPVPTPTECLREFIQAADLLLREGIDLLYSSPQRDSLHSIRAGLTSRLMSTDVLVEAGVAVDALVKSGQACYVNLLTQFAAAARAGSNEPVLARMDLARQLLNESGLLRHRVISENTRLLFCNFDVLLGGAIDGTEHLWAAL